VNLLNIIFCQEKAESYLLLKKNILYIFIILKQMELADRHIFYLDYM